MNKGKKIIQKVDGTIYICYRCTRCGVIVHESQWKKDTHARCDVYLKSKTIRVKVEKTALRVFIEAMRMMR